MKHDTTGNNALSFCTNYPVVLTATDQQKKETYIHRARCKQWSCDYCSNVNRRLWMYRIGAEIEGDDKPDEWHFWTLTLHGRDHAGGAVHSLMVWRKHWDKFMKRVRRMSRGKKLRYVRVFEPHKSGVFHVHMLANYAPDDVVCHIEPDGRENWRSQALTDHLSALGLGWRHDVRPLKPFGDLSLAGTIASYLGKYLTKDIQSSVRRSLQIADMSRVRMIQTSLGWFKQCEDSVALDFYPTAPLSVEDVNRANRLGFDVYDLQYKDYIDSFHLQRDVWPDRVLDRANVDDSL